MSNCFPTSLLFIALFESIKIFGVLAEHRWLPDRRACRKQNDCWFVSPVESVGDDVVVHKLPPPPKLDGDVELWEKRKKMNKQK